MTLKPVVVIGAGLAGLSCARLLLKDNIDVQVLESQNAIGGRVRTDSVDGFLLDRGFQVLQTAYPEATSQLDYEALQLHAFEPGALIRTQGRTLEMSDPWRRPGKLFFHRVQWHRHLLGSPEAGPATMACDSHVR